MLFQTCKTFAHAEHKQRWLGWLRSGVLENGGRLGEKTCWINYVIIVFFAHKKHSRSFVKLPLNTWCHMDYFTDVLATFLCIDHGNNTAVYGGSESSQIPSKIS